jgi:hypothetical protein
VSDGHAATDEHTSVGPVALNSPGDRFLSGVSYYPRLLISTLAARRPHKAHADTHFLAQDADRYSTLLNRIDEVWSRHGRVSGDANEVAA